MQPYIAQIISISQIVNTEYRPELEVSSGAYTVAMNFSTDDAYSSCEINPLLDMRLIDLLLLRDEPIDGLRGCSIIATSLLSFDSTEVADFGSVGDLLTISELVILVLFDCIDK